MKGDLTRKSYIDYYVKNLINLCNLFRNVIVFCDYECASYLSEHHCNAEIRIMKLEQLEKMKDVSRYETAFTHMKNIILRHKKYKHPLKKRRQSCIVKDNASLHQNAIYAALTNSKIDLLLEASKWNPYKTEYFYWADAGCACEKHRQSWLGWDGRILHKPSGFRISLDMSKWNRQKVKYLWTVKNIAFCWPPGNQMAAKFMGGGMKYLRN